MLAACSPLLLHAQRPWVEQLPGQVTLGDNTSSLPRLSRLCCREPWMMACFQMMPRWGA